jgi:hypothetical protein
MRRMGRIGHGTYCRRRFRARLMRSRMSPCTQKVLFEAADLLVEDETVIVIHTHKSYRSYKSHTSYPHLS